MEEDQGQDGAAGTCLAVVRPQGCTHAPAGDPPSSPPLTGPCCRASRPHSLPASLISLLTSTQRRWLLFGLGHAHPLSTHNQRSSVEVARIGHLWIPARFAPHVLRTQVPSVQGDTCLSNSLCEDAGASLSHAATWCSDETLRRPVGAAVGRAGSIILHYHPSLHQPLLPPRTANGAPSSSLSPSLSRTSRHRTRLRCCGLSLGS